MCIGVREVQYMQVCERDVAYVCVLHMRVHIHTRTLTQIESRDAVEEEAYTHVHSHMASRDAVEEEAYTHLYTHTHRIT